MTAAYVSDPALATVTAWVPLAGTSLLVTAEPLRDSATGLYARLTYREALAACARLGCRLPTAVEVDAIRDDALKPGGCLLTPVTLPDAEMTAPIVGPGYQAAFAAMLAANMGGQPWCELHDSRVAAQLAAMGWDQSRPAMNAGKWYIGGAPAGRAWLQGWWVPAHGKGSAAYIQAGHEAPGALGPHSDIGSRDYATLPMAITDGSAAS